MKTIKKIVAITLTLAMVLSVAPAIATNVRAGGEFEIIDIVSGASKTQNEDKTYDVKALKTVEFSLTKLNNKLPGFRQRYLDGNKTTTIEVNVYSDAKYTKKIATLKPGLTGDYIEFKALYKYKGCVFYFLFNDADGGYNNLQSELFKIVDGQITIVDGPTFGNIYGTKTFLKKIFTVGLNGYGIYKLNDDPKEYYAYKKIVKLYRNGKLVGTQSTEEYGVEFKNIPVSYGKNDTFKAALFMNIEGVEVAGPTTTWKSTSEKIPNIKVHATKISKKKAYLRWQSVGGISGYYIYMGKKKVKTVGAKTTKKMITKKKAGKSKFAVIPFVKVGKKVYKSNSNKAKPKKNQAKWIRNLNVKSYGYATCEFKVTKISLSGKTYKVTGYALNNRMFKVEKYKYLILSLKVDGKKAFYKKIKNIKLNIKKYKKKKFTFKVKGKAGKDLVYGNPYVIAAGEPDWGIKNDSFKN